MTPIFNLINKLRKQAEGLLKSESNLEKTHRPVIIKEDMGIRYVEGILTPAVVDNELGDVIDEETFAEMVADEAIEEDLASDPAFFTKVMVLD